MAGYGAAEYGESVYGMAASPGGPNSTYGVGVYGTAVYGGSSVSSPTVRATRTWIEAA